MVNASAIRRPDRDSEDIVDRRHGPQPSAAERGNKPSLLRHHYNVRARAYSEGGNVGLPQQLDPDANPLDFAQPLPALSNVGEIALKGSAARGARHTRRDTRDAAIENSAGGNIERDQHRVADADIPERVLREVGDDPPRLGVDDCRNGVPSGGEVSGR